MLLDEDIEVGLLIGLNCARAIKPLEVIPGKQDDSYSKKTALGGLGLGAKDGGRGFECSAFPSIISCYQQGK